MKKILSLILIAMICTGFIACGKSNVAIKADIPKVHKQGEEVFMLDDDSKQIYSITINGVKTANDFEYKTDFPESNQKQIIEVDYTYKNIAKNDENKLLIHSADLQVSDLNGAVADFSSMFPKGKPRSITVGTNCTVQAYYGLINKSDKVKISFSSEFYKKSGIIIFEIQAK